MSPGAKRIVADVRAKTVRVEEFDFTPPPPEPPPEEWGIGLEQVKELLRWRDEIIQPQLASLDQRLRVLEEKLMEGGWRVRRADPWTRRLAIVCLTVILLACRARGVDHFLIASISAIIGGIAGWRISGRRRRR